MSAAVVSPPIETIPNEILEAILEPFNTKEILPLVPVCRHFHLVIARLLHRRLLDIDALTQDRKLILECYQPIHKLSTPYLACNYLDTRARGVDAADGDGSLVLSDLKGVYSSFRPAVAEENRRWHILEDGGPVNDSITEDINLDEGELFVQLATVTNVVKPGPRAGVFLSYISVFDGVLRVWRDWMAEMSEAGNSGRDIGDKGILWLDADKTVGVRFRVTLGPMERMPIISSPEDQPPICYRLHYEELLVQTKHLLLAVEQSAVQEVSNSGVAALFWNFPSFK